MRKLLLILCLAAFPAALAQTSGTGVGIIAGEPTGLCIKQWTSDRTALVGALAWSFEHDGALHVHGDFLLHNFNLFSGESSRVIFYYGVGGRMRFGEEGEENVLGVRVPVGVIYPFSGDPIDIFLELVPIMDLVPETDFNAAGGIGARYFF
ncbi:hypothetical protein JW921_06370 [Candidatus Fermentibacterales bacterium]|nr:hypothetical protein [Candidatus Fermentibacterales bacterium]